MRSFREEYERLLAKVRHPLVAELRRLDEEAAVSAIATQLRESYRMWAALPELASCVRFYWAGAEVEPWIPGDVFANVYASHDVVDGRFKPRRRLREALGGFDPVPLPILCAAAAGGLDVGDDLKALFVAKSLELAARALAETAPGPEFDAVKTWRPFTFFAAPGHDEPAFVLHVVD